jgi:hypothetical protein
MELSKTIPSERIGHKTHLFTIFPKTHEIVCLLDHYYCDGIILVDLFKDLFPEITAKIPFPKYKYYPFISDAFACECAIRNLYDVFKMPSLIKQCASKRMLVRVLHKKDFYCWNRWLNYAANVLPIFECTKGLKYARIALTVAIDTDSTFGNNRIGIIPVLIDRPPKTLSYESKLRFLMKQFESKVTQNYRDCITTYDTLRSYDTSFLRKHATSKCIDIAFTSFHTNSNCVSLDRMVGGFIGHHEFPYFYINATTLNGINHVSYTTNWSAFNHKKYIKDFDATLMYTFA